MVDARFGDDEDGLALRARRLAAQQGLRAGPIQRRVDVDGFLGRDDQSALVGTAEGAALD